MVRSHTEIVLSLGGQAIYRLSTKQKSNTSTSTEAKLVCVNDALAQVLWTRQILGAQGFSDTDPVIYQENQSSMLLEIQGRGSSAK